MRLLLSMLRWPDGAKPETREIESELSIGRGRDAEWMFVDPAHQLSRRHCVLTPFGEGWRITDLSLNGTFVNDAIQPIGREQSYELHDGDQIRIGPYVIEARYQAPASLARPFADPLPPPFTAPHGWAGPGGGGFAAPEFTAPEFTAPGFTAPGFTAPGFEMRGHAMTDGFVGPPSGDHSPAMSDAWTPPPPGRVVLPEDWDLEEVPPASPPCVPPSSAAPPARPVPPARARDEPDQTLETLRGGTPLPATLPGAGDAALLAAFLRGAGLREVGDVDPAAMMEAVGATLRVMVDRLREVQANRSTIKREFRILGTVVRPDDNNPIKFSANNEAALRALLNGRQPADRAVGEVLDDIRLHELAMIAAMRDAVRGLLAELDPAPLRAGMQAPGLGGMLPMQRRARAFEQYEALHARIVQALADDFDSVFGKAFARAYERVALDDENRPVRARR